MPSKIEWTEHTWNPITGCTPISEGCRNCYARRMHSRLQAMGQDKYKYDFNTIVVHLGVFNEPIRRKKPSMYFVCSMSDLFHKDVPPGDIKAIFNVMEQCKHHTFQVLTKRPERLRELMLKWYPQGVPKNIWLGVTIENQDNIDRALYLDLDANARFISCEPLLGPIDFGGILWHHIDWVIVGAESGPGARPMKEDWVRSIRDQCIVAEIPFFYKQKQYCGKKVSMPELDGVIWDQIPEAE